MIITSLDHINIVVSDMARAEAFYGGVLGMEKTFDKMLEGEWLDEVTGLSNSRARCVFFQFPDTNVRLELLEYFEPARVPLLEASLPNLPGVRHFAFDISDMDAFVRRMAAAGVQFVSGPVTVPFAVNGKRKRLCYFHDPDGTLLEVAEYRALED